MAATHTPASTPANHDRDSDADVTWRDTNGGFTAVSELL